MASNRRPGRPGATRPRSRLFSADPSAMLVDEWVPTIVLPPPPPDTAGRKEHEPSASDSIPVSPEPEEPRVGPARIYVGDGKPIRVKDRTRERPGLPMPGASSLARRAGPAARQTSIPPVRRQGSNRGSPPGPMVPTASRDVAGSSAPPRPGSPARKSSAPAPRDSPPAPPISMPPTPSAMSGIRTGATRKPGSRPGALPRPGAAPGSLTRRRTPASWFRWRVPAFRISRRLENALLVLLLVLLAAITVLLALR